MNGARARWPALCVRSCGRAPSTMAVPAFTNATSDKAPLPWPLVRFWRHPLRWIRNKVELAIAALVLAHVGTLIVVGLYYLLFEVYAPITHAWHSVVPSNSTRHLLRNVYEGVLGGTLAQFVVFNHFARRRARLGRLDEWEIRHRLPNLKDHRPLSGWQLVIAPLLVLIYAIPGLLVGTGVAWLIRHNINIRDYVRLVGNSHVERSVWGHLQTLWTSNRDQRVVGFFASVFLGRRPIRAVAEDLQCYFAARRVALGKPPRFYHPPNFRARMNASTAEATAMRMDGTAGWVPYLLSFAIAMSAVLAGFGVWVLAVKA